MSKYHKNEHKKLVGAGHITDKITHRPARLEDDLPQEQREICEHLPYCDFRKRMRDSEKYINCFVPQDIYKCGQVKKYYDKWGEAGNQLGI